MDMQEGLDFCLFKAMEEEVKQDESVTSESQEHAYVRDESEILLTFVVDPSEQLVVDSCVDLVAKS
jgi:hypothetical protein